MVYIMVRHEKRPIIFFLIVSFQIIMSENISSGNIPPLKLGMPSSLCAGRLLTIYHLSWIGSVQLLLTLSVGLFSGRGFDTGY
jgi:hypothetical protein